MTITNSQGARVARNSVGFLKSARQERVETARHSTDFEVVRGGGGAGEKARQHHVERHVARAQLLAVAHLDVLDLRGCKRGALAGAGGCRVGGRGVGSPSRECASALPQVSTRTSCSSMDLMGAEHSSTRICAHRPLVLWVNLNPLVIGANDSVFYVGGLGASFQPLVIFLFETGQ